MNKIILEKLKEFIRACIKEEAAKNSSDGGLIESVQKNEIEKELDKLVMLNEMGYKEGFGQWDLNKEI